MYMLYSQVAKYSGVIVPKKKEKIVVWIPRGYFPIDSTSTPTPRGEWIP